jgi:hypothetical protein
VDKIVILTDHSEGDDKLIACLSMVFPECEIQILSRRTEDFGDVRVAPEPLSTQKEGKKNGKHSDCR